MKTATFRFGQRATALRTIFFIVLLLLPLVSACPGRLQCRNFTDPQKRSDCNYVVSQGFPAGEQAEIICTIWDQDYGYNIYNNPIYPPINPDLTLDYNEIDNSSFILAFKILLLGLFFYFVYCVLTKPSFIRKCLPAA
jgi:hypothetical protein